MLEKELMIEYFQCLSVVNEMEEEIKLKKEELNFAKNKLIEYMTDRGVSRTASYDGMGSITLKSFNTYKVDEENQEKLLAFIKENGLEWIIKQSIHHKTLDRVMNELVEEGKALPEYINTYTVQTVQINK